MSAKSKSRGTQINIALSSTRPDYSSSILSIFIIINLSLFQQGTVLHLMTPILVYIYIGSNQIYLLF